MFKGSIPALITPFTKDGNIDIDAFDALMQWHLSEGSDAIVLCGITGESPTLTPEEQRMIIARGVQLAKGNVPIIAGTGCASTQLTVHLTRQAKEAGADGCLVIVPYCNRPTAKGCLQHYTAVDRVGLPLIVYHHPSRSNVKLPLAALAEILTLPHVIGIKEGSADLAYATELSRLTPVPLLCGDDILTPAMMGIGAQGVISIVANVIPSAWKSICAHFLQGDFAQGRRLFRQYQPLVEAMILEINPQCVKYALSLLDKCAPHLRLPLVEPQELTKKKIQETLQQAVLESFGNSRTDFLIR
jgi:4-hydroxy-tetrahydrodipicolinate synthase